MGQKMPVPVINLGSCPKTPSWYTVVTKYNYEKKFANDVMQGLKNADLDKYILEVVVPIKETEMTSITKNGKPRKTTKVEKIYPLYVFVKAIMNERVWNHLRLTNGASTVLATGGFPSIMEEKDINVIKELCGLNEKEKKAKKEAAKSNFKGKVGDKIMVINGVFAGFTGKINMVDTNKGKCKVSLDLNNMNAEFSFEDVEVQ